MDVSIAVKPRRETGGPGAGVDNLLLETTDHFLLESGTTDVLLTE